MDEALYPLFRTCILRLTTPNDNGTSFFVAPGLVLTCAHVVKATPLHAIELHWQGHTYTPTHLDATTTSDLALLTVPASQHPCAMLDATAEPGDKLYSYGYPAQREGESITVECTGPSDNGQLLTLKDEHLRPGFSGAPLLNQRTQKVCGIIKEDSDGAKPDGDRH